MLTLDDVLLILYNLDELSRNPRRFMAKLMSLKYAKWVGAAGIALPLSIGSIPTAPVIAKLPTYLEKATVHTSANSFSVVPLSGELFPYVVSTAGVGPRGLGDAPWKVVAHTLIR